MLEQDDPDAKPFIKWAGGKRHLLSKIDRFLPQIGETTNYYEPFLGSGAMFFHLRPKSAILSDCLLDVVTAFRVVRDNVEDLIETLKPLEEGHKTRGSDFYYEVRRQDPKMLDNVHRAARFIYLNKTCYNGIYRVNSKGEFNVPIGLYKNPNILDAKTLRAASLVVKNASIRQADYTKSLQRVSKGDFVYLDPPYFGRFTSYHENGFGKDKQRELAEWFRRLHDRGAYLLMSNGAGEEIMRLYTEFNPIKLMNRVYLSGKLEGRRNMLELLVLNYDPTNGELVHV